jgi:hypothetical protein
MRHLRSIIARIRAWWSRNRAEKVTRPSLPLSFGASIHRDVTRNGVRFYSLCGACGARMDCSATLCEECAQGPHPSTF